MKIFNRTTNHLQSACGSMYDKMEKSLKLLRKIYFIEIVVLLIIGGAIAIFMSSYAAPNKSFVYQGRITGGDYLPLDDGTYYMRIKLFDTLSGGTCAWSTGTLTTGANCVAINTDSRIPVVVTRSTFSLPIGDTNYDANMPNIASLDFKNNTYFIEVQFAITSGGTYELFAPRTKLGSSASAVTVLDALQANTFNQIPGTYATVQDNPLTVGATSITVALNATNGYPSAGTLLVENELMTYTGTTSTAFTGVTRARFETIAASHAQNTTMKTYLFSGATNAETRPVFYITSDGSAFINSNSSTINPQIGFQVSGTTNYTLGIDRLADSTANKFKISTNNIATTGTGTLSSVGTVVTGASTVFTAQVSVGSTIAASGQTRTVDSITDNTTLTTDTAFSPPIIAGTSFTFTKNLLALDSRSTFASAGQYSAFTFYGLNNTLASSSNANYTTLTVTPPTITLSGSTQVTSLMDSVFFGRPTIASITQGINDASTFTVAGPPLLTAGVMTNAFALKINSASTNGGAAPVNAYGLAVAAPTGASSGNYAAIFTGGNVGIGTTTPITQLHINGSVPSGETGHASTNTFPNAVKIQGNYAYVVNLTGNTLQIFDVSNPTSPTSIGGISTGGGTNPQEVSVSGRYAYVANYSGTIGIYDISNPASPSLTGSVNTGTNPRSIFMQGRYVYVVDDTTNLIVIDISNPASPTLISTTNIGASNAYNVFIQGKYAYFFTNGASSLLKIYNISNPSTPTLTSSTDVGSLYAYSIFVQGRYAYFVNGTTPNTFRIYDISDPSSPTSVGSLSLGNSSAVWGVSVQGRYAYVTDQGSPTYLRTIDISNPALPTLIGSTPTDSSPRGIFVQGRYAYSTSTGANTLQIFDIGGAYIQQLETGGLEIANGSVRNNFTINNSLDVKGGMNIGIGGLYSAGPLSATGLGGNSDTTSALDIRNSVGTNLLYVRNDLKVGIGTTTPSYTLSFNGSDARWIGVETAAADTAGSGLYLHAGSSGTGTDLAGGGLTLQSGNSTGTAQSKIQIQVPQKGASGTSVNSVATMFEFVNGHIATIAIGSSSPTTLPALGTCTGGTLSTSPQASDTSGKITGITGSACTLNFATVSPYNTAPACFPAYEGSDSLSLRVSAISTTSVTFTFSSAPTTPATISYLCVGIGAQ